MTICVVYYFYVLLTHWQSTHEGDMSVYIPNVKL